MAGERRTADESSIDDERLAEVAAEYADEDRVLGEGETREAARAKQSRERARIAGARAVMAINKARNRPTEQWVVELAATSDPAAAAAVASEPRSGSEMLRVMARDARRFAVGLAWVTYCVVMLSGFVPKVEHHGLFDFAGDYSFPHLWRGLIMAALLLLAGLVHGSRVWVRSARARAAVSKGWAELSEALTL